MGRATKRGGQKTTIKKPLMKLMLFIMVVLFSLTTKASENFIKGPVDADLLKVIDGDTILVKAYIWPGQQVETKVRVYGIDAPEKRGSCQYERRLAQEAKIFVEQNISKKVKLYDLHWGKYAGRIIAKVHNNDDKDIFQNMLNKKLAHKYKKESKKTLWCKDY